MEKINVKALKGLNLEDGSKLLISNGYFQVNTFLSKYGCIHFCLKENDSFTDIIFFGPEDSIWVSDSKLLKLLNKALNNTILNTKTLKNEGLSFDSSDLKNKSIAEILNILMIIE